MGDPLDAQVDRSSGVPLSAQLAAHVRAAVADGRLATGDRLPSVRELADQAGVNVNTVRAVYARLEAEGAVRSEHGRGTFVADPLVSSHPADSRTLSRGELRDQIAALEATLAKLPPPPLRAHAEPRRQGTAALLSAEELVDVRDRLLERLRQIDSERSALLESLDQLGVEPRPEAEDAPSRGGTPSLAGARIRWVGA
ncbi:MAG TPA: GntR family transcriptional regulator [Thermoleophilaceae bacterium]|jgi:DNA-binding transcriptional regulator YhcF (GntR family)|nr:GntR family transcriptional regulator [Thermoleophilaceae bacterium]